MPYRIVIDESIKGRIDAERSSLPDGLCGVRTGASDPAGRCGPRKAFLSIWGGVASVRHARHGGALEARRPASGRDDHAASDGGGPRRPVARLLTRAAPTKAPARLITDKERYVRNGDGAADGRRTRVLTWLEGEEAAMIDLLRTLVNIDSGSYSKPGIDAAAEVVSAFLESQGIACETIELPEQGNIVRAVVPGTSGGNANTLLMGHLDTVFPDGEAERRPFTIADGRAYGPGVADMKAGIVMNCFVAAALARAGGAPDPLVLLITGDEEIASPASAEYIRREAGQARYVFNAEPGRANGNVVTARRACIFARIRVEGRAAHSGVNFPDGASAIEEMSRKVMALHELTDLERSISVNVGLISGGQSVNTVAPTAVASLDLRYLDPADRDGLVAALRDIVERCTVENTSATLEVYGEFPPMHLSDASTQLFERYREASRRLGVAVNGELTNGAADSGFAAAEGAATLCGLGPVGGKYHGEEEYIELSSLLTRARVLAETILDI